MEGCFIYLGLAYRSTYPQEFQLSLDQFKAYFTAWVEIPPSHL
jgi:hypothetical protein